VPEDAVVQAQPVLLDAHELREREAERGVVAERAEVAEVVGDALALEHERAQPRARGGGTIARSDLGACAYAHAKATVESPDTRPASRWPSATVNASKRLSIPLWT
jgi:hypothetical protein